MRAYTEETAAAVEALRFALGALDLIRCRFVGEAGGMTGPGDIGELMDEHGYAYYELIEYIDKERGRALAALKPFGEAEPPAAAPAPGETP